MDSELGSLTESPAVVNNMGMDAGDFFVSVAGYFLVLAIIIVGFIFFRKYLLGRIGGIRNGSGSAVMKIKDRLIIAQDKQIILLEINDKIIMVGISAQSMSTLGEFEKDELDEIYGKTDGLNKNSPNNGSFLSILSEKFKTGFDNIDKNKKN